MSRNPVRRLAPLLGALLLLLAPPIAAREPDRPDLSGRWVLDPGAARAPDGAPNERADADERPAGRPSGGRGGRRPTGGGEGDPAAFRERMAGLERAAAKLDLRAVEGGFLLRDGAGQEWPLLPGSLERAVPGADGVETYVRSEWQEDGSLRFWRVRAAVPTVVATLALDAETDTLTVDTTLADGARAQRRVYRREAAPTSPVPPDSPVPPPPDGAAERGNAGSA